MNASLWKKIGIGAAIVAFFLILSYGFVPQVLKGEIVNQSDISGYVGMAHEMSQWNKEHPEDPTYWTGSMFSGMPTTPISLQNKGDWTQPVYDFLLLGKRPATYLFIALLGAFLLMLSLGVSWPLAIGGAVAIAFCSYNFQIIQVGHNTKMQAIAFMPWVLAALIFTYQSAFSDKLSKRKLWTRMVLGATLFGLALSMQIKANHQQITYYLAILVILYALVLLVDVLWKHRDKTARFFMASALLLVLGLVGIATNLNKLIPLYDYTQYTMRGGSELSHRGAGSEASGLEIGYATAWSYGWEELPNLMIPNFNGGASSAAIDPDKSETVALLKKYGQGASAQDIARNFPAYWGPQPFTAGPMYMGAITVFLFLLGLLLYKGKEKWWLLAATILAVLMAVGSHFMAFTRLCFNVLPLYNKFRTVSMALVVLQVTLPLLGFVTLDRILTMTYQPEKVRKNALIAWVLTGGFCLLMAIFPFLAGNFLSNADFSQPEVLQDVLKSDRIALFRKDAFVSFLIISFAFATIIWSFTPKYAAEKRRKNYCGIVISALILLNLFVVGKRYLNSSHFTTPRNFDKAFAERTVDKIVKADPDPDYRVLDLSVSVFNSSVPSYHHKNIGGYSPAKLQRYQDLIDRYLTSEINAIYKSLQNAATVAEAQDALPDTPLLNALNTKYFILGADYAPLYNENTFGHAWFVDEVMPAATPDQEIDLLGQVDLQHTAVLAAPDAVPAGISSPEEGIELVSYAPNELHYRYSAANDRLAVFSEIWYPDWKISLAGEEAPEIRLLRADWTLRAAVLPAGDHELVFRFEPESYARGAVYSRISSITLLLLLLLSIGLSIKGSFTLE